MNNGDLADRIAAANGVSKADARKLVDAVFAAIADAASRGEEVSLNGFGKFKVKDSPAREGRNPSTGATIQICKQERVPVKMVLNRVNPQAKLTGAISGEMVGLTANRFGNRVAFAGSLMQGYGVTEYDPNSLAAEEVRALAKEIIDYLNRKTAAGNRASA